MMEHVRRYKRLQSALSAVYRALEGEDDQQLLEALIEVSLHADEFAALLDKGHPDIEGARWVGAVDRAIRTAERPAAEQ